MSSYVVGLMSFAAIFGGVLIGRFAVNRLPGHHLSSETQSAITVSVAVIGILSALVLGLMISAAYSSVAKASDEVKDLSLQLIRIDRNLRRYGPEATEARATLHIWFSRRRGNPLYQVKRPFKCLRTCRARCLPSAEINPRARNSSSREY